MADTENATEVLDEILDEQPAAAAPDAAASPEPESEPTSDVEQDVDVDPVSDELPPSPSPTDYILRMPALVDDDDAESHQAVFESWTQAAPAAGLDHTTAQGMVETYAQAGSMLRDLMVRTNDAT